MNAGPEQLRVRELVERFKGYKQRRDELELAHAAAQKFSTMPKSVVDELAPALFTVPELSTGAGAGNEFSNVIADALEAARAIGVQAIVDISKELMGIVARDIMRLKQLIVLLTCAMLKLLLDNQAKPNRVARHEVVFLCNAPPHEQHVYSQLLNARLRANA
ncbi:MAG: hypothetical protein KBG84_13665 [Planctomycetes bacterium]|nr:hypothetical protein [Planctomycetota bacterium]